MSVTGACSLGHRCKTFSTIPTSLGLSVINLIKIYVFQIVSKSLIIKLIVLPNSYYLRLTFYFRQSSSSYGKCYIMIAYSTVNNTTFRNTCRFICNYMINYCTSISSSYSWFINQLRKVVFSINLCV